MVDILGKGHHDQKKRVKKKMIMQVKVLRVEMEIHKRDVMWDHWG